MPLKISRLLPVAVLALSLASPAVVAQKNARPASSAARTQQEKPAASKLTPAQAAARARAQHGGKVLKVQRAGKGYKVRLLQDSGRVITVTVGN